MPSSDKDLSNRKLEEYSKFSKIAAEGRKNPIWFSEEFFWDKTNGFSKTCFYEELGFSICCLA